MVGDTLPVVDSLAAGRPPVVGTPAGSPAEGIAALAAGTHTPAVDTHTPVRHSIALDDGDQTRTWTTNHSAG